VDVQLTPDEPSARREVLAVVVDHVARPQWGLAPGPCVVELRREPENRADPNAVQVLLDGRVVRYLPRYLAAMYCSLIEDVEADGHRAVAHGRVEGPRGDRDIVVLLAWLDEAYTRSE
jgi:hypothetical protein